MTLFFQICLFAFIFVFLDPFITTVIQNILTIISTLDWVVKSLVKFWNKSLGLTFRRDHLSKKIFITFRGHVHVLTLHGLHTLGQVHCIHPEYPWLGHVVHARVTLRTLSAEPGKRCASPESFLLSVVVEELMVTILIDDNGDNECKGNYYFHNDIDISKTNSGSHRITIDDNNETSMIIMSIAIIIPIIMDDNNAFIAIIILVLIMRSKQQHYLH